MSFYPQPYTFYSNRTPKVQDSTGLVHETERAEGVPFGSRTRCENTQWHMFEPLVTVDDAATTTCILCLGAKRDG